MVLVSSAGCRHLNKNRRPETYRSQSKLCLHGKSSKQHRYSGIGPGLVPVSTALDRQEGASLGALFRLGHVGIEAYHRRSVRSVGRGEKLAASQRENCRRDFRGGFPGRNKKPRRQTTSVQERRLL